MPSQLKSLELHGYKTFANRTLFEFAETVTAIVGPNGSGKSNIADSLRWVLGEQSYGLLRAKRTEDMIFSGSESRPRAGMASASITFDNSDGWLPIDFSEVSITRRAHRDGLNEYLINGQRVRLKDVNELLAQSGLAERTYTVIGQGLVDAALALKADERRRLFEEAAGIGLHRSRREEALRRLEATQRNLERVEDILAELKPRLGSLERQARRALEYEQLRSDLQVLLREWYGFHWHDAQQGLTEARQSVQLHETHLEQVRAEQGTLEQELVAQRQQVHDLRARLDEWHRSLSELHSRREATSRELAVGEERERSTNDQQESLQRQKSGLEEELSFHERQLQAAIAELERILEEQKEASAQLQIAREALEARQAERAQVERLAQATRQEVAGMNSRQGQLQARLAESRSQAERAEQALQVGQHNLAQAERDHQQAEINQNAAHSQAQAAETSLQASEESLAQQRSRTDKAEEEFKIARDQRAGLAAESARLKARQEVLDQAESALTGYASGTRLLLQAARQKRLSGARGALSNYIEAPAHLERALAAALGEYLDAVILDEPADPALDLLSTGSGRGVLLPLESLARLEPLDVPADPEAGLLGNAASLVTCTPEFRPVIDLLLGNVLVTTERTTARRILQTIDANLASARPVRVVTLQGEVFYASGPVQAAGSSEGGDDQSLLARGRQRRDLVERLQALAQKMAEADGQLAQLDLEWKESQARQARLAQAVEKARQQAYSARRAAEQAQAALEHASRQLRWNREQRERLEADRSRYQAEITLMVAEAGSVEEHLAQTRQSLRDFNQQLENLTLDDFQAQLAHWTTRLAVAERVASDARLRHNERRETLDRARSNLSDLHARLDQLETSLQALHSQRRSFQQAEAVLTEQIQVENARIEPAEAQLRALEQDQAEREKTESTMRQSLNAAEHAHAQMRITQARRQEALQSLRRRIEDDFGLVAFEYVEQVSGPTPLPLQGMVEQLPRVNRLSPEIEENIKRQRAQLRRMGPINPEAQAEYTEVKQRYEFLTDQLADLHKAQEDVREVIHELDNLMVREFRRTFEAVAAEFRQIFTRLFGGGSARLMLTDPEDLTTTGIDIEARLPGRRMQGLSLLSGGERSLTAAALVFALLKVSPTPFCVLDEVDAMLDEANVGRFRELLRELSQKTQFVIVTHNRNTVQAADVIYGVTMGRDSASQVLSLRMDQVGEVVD